MHSSLGDRRLGLGFRICLHEGPQAAHDPAEHRGHCVGECWIPSCRWVLPEVLLPYSALIFLDSSVLYDSATLLSLSCTK